MDDREKQPRPTPPRATPRATDAERMAGSWQEIVGYCATKPLAEVPLKHHGRLSPAVHARRVEEEEQKGLPTKAAIKKWARKARRRAEKDEEAAINAWADDAATTMQAEMDGAGFGAPTGRGR